MLCYLCRSSLFHEVYQVHLIPDDNFRQIVCVIVWTCGWSHRAVFWSGYHGHVIRLPDTQLYNCVVGQSTRLISLYACSCCVSVPFLLLFLVPFILHMTHFHIYVERALVAFRFHFSFISPAFSLHMSLFHCSSGTNVSICTNQKKFGSISAWYSTYCPDRPSLPVFHFAIFSISPAPVPDNIRNVSFFQSRWNLIRELVLLQFLAHAWYRVLPNGRIAVYVTFSSSPLQLVSSS